MDTQDSREAVRDYRLDHGLVEEDDITSHHTDKWQQQAMYVGLHFPKSTGKHRRRRKHSRRPGDTTISADNHDSANKPRTNGFHLANGYGPPATPPSQRVQFLLGREEDGEEMETHDVFCEMDTLRHGEDGDMEWKETARWIKFEEDLEEGGERWSKPHVATLSLHSLFELRKGIMSGTVMLDVDATSRIQIIELVVESLIASKQMDIEHKDKVIDVLAARHRHPHQRKHEKGKGLPLIRSLADIGRKTSEKKLEGKVSFHGYKPTHGTVHEVPHASTSTGLSLAPPRTPHAPTESKEINKSVSSGHLTPGGMGRKNSSKDLESDVDLHETPSQVKFNEHFLKKIPPGAEASNILVGEVDFLTHPILAFVRLSKATLLGDLTEVPVPTRFIFFLLGPTGNQTRYNEIGRSIATLMSDEVFHDVAYKARNRNDLLAGIDEFLDQVTVLPPGEWDPTIRIEPPKSVPSQEGRKKKAPDGQSNGMPSSLVLKELAEMEEPEAHCDPTLERTGRLFGGLVADIKRKLPWYKSDVKDALHIQCIASFFFMYFACLTPIITFGGLLASATDRWIAAMESLVSGAICGVTYHLFSGQPLTIIGSTGPVLVFETIVYSFCHDQGLDYLAFRFWIGIWMSAILLLMVMFDLSALVKYITRFTEESFAMLIALIFIVEAFKKLFHIMDHYAVNLDGQYGLDYNCTCWPKDLYMNLTNTTDGKVLPHFVMPQLVEFENETWNGTGESIYSAEYNDVLKKYNYDEKYCKDHVGISVGDECAVPPYRPDVFFFCVILFIFTYIISMGLKFFRNTRFLPNKVRVIVSDFAVFTAIVLMVTFDILIGLPTPKLEVPEEFRPTRTDRGWFVDPFTNPLWCIPAAILPSLLATILIFMDQQITAVIVNRKENKLLKGGGYHLDLFLIAIQVAVCSMLGTPWFVAATVLSINHVRSLTRESETAAPGERPKFLGVREQRVTGTLVFMMVGLSALMSTVLKRIPMAVLFGVFLFMGTSSLKGIQLMQRVLIIFMPPKYQPDYVYLRQVPLRRVHLFTAFQIACLVILWVIKSFKEVSIVFPLMVLAMCFVRKGLDWVFTRHELKWLDDIIPESHKREKEEKKKQLVGAEENLLADVIEMSGGAVNIPLKDGKSINIPVDRITYDPRSNQVNISDEMSSTAIWKQLAANESNPNLQDYELRKRKHKHRSHRKHKNDSPPSEPVKFKIADETDETDALMTAPTPTIVVTQEPSPRNSAADLRA